MHALDIGSVHPRSFTPTSSLSNGLPDGSTGTVSSRHRGNMRVSTRTPVSGLFTSGTDLTHGRWSSTLGSVRSVGAAHGDPLKPPALSLNISKGIAEAQRLDRTLDHLHEAQEKFVGEFHVHNYLARRQGGQGVVQVCKQLLFSKL